MIDIIPAQVGDALEDVILLSQEYASWMLDEVRQRYPDMDLNEMASEHEYDDVRKKFPGEHVPPQGCLLVARQDGVTCGCIALGKLTDTICEMRTLYVRPECRGGGVGKQLAA